VAVTNRATWLDGQVVQAGQTPMAFTFCTDAEFPVLLAKWLAAPLHRRIPT